MSDEAFELRARELWKLYQAAYLKHSEQGDPYVSDCQKSALLAVADHVRREAIEQAAKAVNALDAPPETTDANIGELRGLCRAEQAVRALLPAPQEGGGDG